jgi:hypothetical protein
MRNWADSQLRHQPQRQPVAEPEQRDGQEALTSLYWTQSLYAAGRNGSATLSWKY